MRSMIRTALIAAALTAAGGCIFDGSDDHLTVQVNFNLLDPGPPPSAPVIQVIGSTVQLNHRFQSPAACYAFDAEADQNGIVIELTIAMTADPNPSCPTGAAEWSYVAIIAGAEPGTTRIAVTVLGGASPVREEFALPTPTS